MTFAVLGHNADYDVIELPVVTVVTAMFVIIEKLARDLQTPFDNKVDDTPMSALCTAIEIDLRQMLRDDSLPEEIRPINGVPM